MNRGLILITTAFPFAAGEPYLETEIPYLAKAFSRVLIFTIGLHPDCRTALPLPENVTAFNCASTPPKKARVADAVRGAAVIVSRPDVPQADWQEAGHAPLCRAFLGYFRARTERHASEIDALLHDMDLSDWDEALVYGYWFFVAAAAAVQVRDSLLRRGVGKVRAISRAHGYDLYTYANRLDYLPCRTMLLDALDAVYPCSRNGAAYLREKYPAYTGKIQPAFLGTQDGEYRSGSQDGVFRILTCARTVPLKRLDRLAGVLSTICVQHPVEWTHIGDGPSLEQLRQIARRFPANVTARFTGALPHAQVLACYRAHPVDLFVLVSEREGLPVSVMEALSFGVPAVVTDVGGCTELIRDGENGYVLPADFDDAQLLAVLERAMCAPVSMRAAAFAQWRQHSDARNNYPAFIRTVQALFET